MNQRLGNITLVVNDYDEALEFYVKKLGFDLIEDTKLNDTKRWVVIRPKGDGNCSLLLAKAVNEEQKSRIGNQTGHRVFLFLFTDDIQRDYKNLKKQNIEIVRDLQDELYGKVLVFRDLYGTLWDLIEPKKEK